MKNLTVVDFAIRAAVSVLAYAATFVAYAASPAQSVTPCTYVGRVMDAEHVGFDTNHVAEISAYENASNRLVATTKTFYQADSRRNYALRIPMASKQVDGALTPGSTVRIEVKEPNGTVWSGLVVDEDAKIGGPGSVKVLYGMSIAGTLIITMWLVSISPDADLSMMGIADSFLPDILMLVINSIYYGKHQDLFVN